MNKTFYVIVALVIAFSSFSFVAGKRQSQPPVDNTEYNLLVCFNGAGQPFYSGQVEDVAYRGTSVLVTEASGLERRINNAACILTTGTKAEWVADSAAKKAAGGRVDDHEHTARGASEGSEDVDTGEPVSSTDGSSG